ncbi:hypothetical protein LOK49_LG09G00815 [Camellia lanceoleosa]|uniref:Uncharacterized protein n=1 Tax=Camellia lanceoleosa TaxID=1840588 RepID=A0ACC0GGT1_9ERIC|nr:hypothetical protein LOK49_LG09G00815 [Camellia lanceoleosa]
MSSSIVSTATALDFGRQSKPSIGYPLTLYMLVLQLPPEVSCFLGYSLWDYNVICDVPGLRCRPYNGPQFKSFQESWVPMAIALSSQPLLGQPVMVKPSVKKSDRSTLTHKFGLRGGFIGPYLGGTRRVKKPHWLSYPCAATVHVFGLKVKQVLVGIVSSVFLLVLCPDLVLLESSGLFTFMTLRVAARI